MKKMLFLVTLLTVLCVQVAKSQTYDQWIEQSFDYIDTDSIDRAIDCLKQAMRQEPANQRNGLLFVNLGTLQRQQGLLEEAEVSYSCAVALLSDMPSVRANRAQLYAEMERFADAVEDYTVMLQTEPQNEEWLYERGLCRLMMSDTIGAQQDFEYIDTFKPRSAKSRLGMAIVYKAQKQYSLAADLYDALLEANPKSWSLMRDRAEVYYLSNRLGAAMTDITESIKLNPNDPMSYILRAQIRYARGDKEYARRDLSTAQEKGVSKQVISQLLEKMK